MRIVTWNINSVRLRIDLLQKLCKEHDPDIVCLQETKAGNQHFPLEEIKKLGFEYIVHSGEKSYNGVAILSKFEISDSFSLNLYNGDKRHICAKIQDFELHNFYVPAGGDEPDVAINPKYKHKLLFVQLMQDWLIANRKKDDNIILVGDLNIAPHEHDVWSSRQLQNVISHTPPERKALLALQACLGFIDTGRYFVDLNQKLYTWWSYRNRDWKKSNRGRRLDHIWVTRPLAPKLKGILYLTEARDWHKPSDHVPCMLDLI
ncbi:MAG: exodeoxyribonuclease III [Rickettsiaceae bacterium]